MPEKWSDELPNDASLSGADKTYMDALSKIKEGLSKGFDFVSASSSVIIDDESLRQTVLDDVMKVIIAEEHFMKKTPLEQVSRKLNLPLSILEKARTEMLEDVETSAMQSWGDGIEKGTEH